ncbi:hypothetical protein N752_28140 [Desulforamulus aquiferis]|nr:HepT-like ribonuclease domain-containing protein [Desulforamulus aquiferis]RYD01845.1 hypothetical protein N752_28140 [Desulforamulus aquiferis]
MTEEQFFENVLVQDAVIRRYEIIGEATKNLTEETKIKYHDIPWRFMVDMSDVLMERRHKDKILS